MRGYVLTTVAIAGLSAFVGYNVGVGRSAELGRDGGINAASLKGSRIELHRDGHFVDSFKCPDHFTVCGENYFYDAESERLVDFSGAQIVILSMAPAR